MSRARIVKKEKHFCIVGLNDSSLNDTISFRASSASEAISKVLKLYPETHTLDVQPCQVAKYSDGIASSTWKEHSKLMIGNLVPAKNFDAAFQNRHNGELDMSCDRWVVIHNAGSENGSLIYTNFDPTCRRISVLDPLHHLMLMKNGKLTTFGKLWLSNRTIVPRPNQHPWFGLKSKAPRPT